MKFKFKKAYAIIPCVLAAAIYAGCKPEKITKGNGLVAKNTSSFTVTPVANKANYYVLSANATGVLSVKWDLGDGAGSNPGKTIDTVFFPDAGTYNVVLTTTGIGGAVKTSTPQTVTVATSDPKAGNLVKGGKMLAGDDQYWTHSTINAGATMTLDPAKNVMTAKGGNGGHVAVFQPVDLIAGQKYKVDMLVSGSGATDVWFETYVGTKQPVIGSDYSDGGIKIALNTWDGCGKDAFNGKLSAISCNGAGNTFTAATTGTYYLLIKCGGSNMGVTGISFTSVELRGIQ